MSYNIRNVREISNDPSGKFANQLAKKLSKFLTEQQTEKLENKEDIYSAGEDVDVVLRLQNLISTKYFNYTTQYYSPSEPDYDKLKLWIKGDNVGDQVNDISGFNNHGTILGDPMILDGTPFDYGIHTGDTKSICLRFNRPTSEFQNDEYVSIPNATNIQVSGITTGISYFARVRPNTLAQQGGQDLGIYAKMDDTNSNGVRIEVAPTGRISFHIKRAGTEYRVRSSSAQALVAGNVYDIWCTYAVSGNVSHIYINNVDSSLSDPGGSFPAQTDFDGRLMKRLPSQDSGYLYGDLYDFMLFREKVVSATEVGRHYTNKLTLANIPFGQVMVSNYWATYLTTLPAYTTAGYTSTGYNT